MPSASARSELAPSAAITTGAFNRPASAASPSGIRTWTPTTAPPSLLRVRSTTTPLTSSTPSASAWAANQRSNRARSTV